MFDHETMLKHIREKEIKKSVKYNEDSKERLIKICSTKVKTTMIGALSIIEKNFGFLWGLDENGRDTGKELDSDEQYMKELFDNVVRSDILDLGNNQMRNMSAEIQQYNVEWKRYHLQLPVKPEGPKTDE